jgi:multiple antibiotic resistance protein
LPDDPAEEPTAGGFRDGADGFLSLVPVGTGWLARALVVQWTGATAAATIGVFTPAGAWTRMIEIALVAFTTFFATIGPPDVAAIFAGLTHDNTPRERRGMALKGTLIAAGILLFFALLGEAVLERLGISLAALRTAGGILLLLIAIDLVFARPSGGTTTTSEENAEAEGKRDISVFPLATPLIAGPGAMGAAILLIADTEGDRVAMAVVIVTMLGVILLTFLLMLVATQVQRVLGVTGLHVVSRIIGVLLAALAVQFVFDGIAASGLLT